MNRKLSNIFHWQPIGQRILKTCVAVTLCLLYYMLRGYRGADMPAEAAITAIICMDTNLRGTRDNALSRIFGTLIGAFWGFVFLVVVPLIPAVTETLPVLYLLMGLWTLLALYTAVLVKKPEAAGLAAIVFICVVVSYPDVESPMGQAFHRILDVLVGTAIAIGINALRLPRVRRKGRVFFAQQKDLTVNEQPQLPTTILYRLRNLLADGAKICLMSEHAPGASALQLGELQSAVPMIVMDGAAIYDPNENVYRAITAIDPNSCRWLMKRLDGMNLSYFIFTVHRDRNCIFHHGELTEEESAAYQYLKRSPYRYYLEDDHFPVADVVYLKIHGKRKDLEQIQSQLQSAFEKMKLRAVVREQAGLKDSFGLYFYAAHADMQHAKEHLMQLLRQNDSSLIACEIRSGNGCRSEYDAIRLMRRLCRAYEPVWPTNLFQKQKPESCKPSES